MAMLELKVNGETHALDIDPDTPLLWALRDHLQLHGTKYGSASAVAVRCMSTTALCAPAR